MKYKDECEQREEFLVTIRLNSKCSVQITTIIIITISWLMVYVNYWCKIWFIFIIKLTNANERIEEKEDTHMLEERITNGEPTTESLSVLEIN